MTWPQREERRAIIVNEWRLWCDHVRPDADTVDAFMVAWTHAGMPDYDDALAAARYYVDAYDADLPALLYGLVVTLEREPHLRGDNPHLPYFRGVMRNALASDAEWRVHTASRIYQQGERLDDVETRLTALEVALLPRASV